MRRKKRILVACGMAVSTSTMVAGAVTEALKQRGIQVTTKQCQASEVAGFARDVDLVLTTTPLSAQVDDVPVIQSLAFLTGVGVESTLQQIVKALGE